MPGSIEASEDEVFWQSSQKADATIIDVDFDPDTQPYALYVVEVRPKGQPAFRAEVGSPMFGNFDYPESGTLPIVLDHARGKVKIDKSRLRTVKRRRRPARRDGR